jgi:hypothetical protein
MPRSPEAQARQDARTRGYVHTVATRKRAHVSATGVNYGIVDGRSLMRPDGLQSQVASVFSRPDRTIAVTEASNNLPGNRAGVPTLPSTLDRLRDNSRARDLKITDKDGNVTYDARDRKRKQVVCDNSHGCLCKPCIDDRLLARLEADRIRRANIAQSTGRGWA